jgi:hypothetical protein
MKRDQLGDRHKWEILKLITDFELPWWLTVDVSSVLGWLYCVAVGNVANVSEVHAAFIFRVEVCRVGEFLCIKRYGWESGPTETVESESCAKKSTSHVKGHKCTKRPTATGVPK